MFAIIHFFKNTQHLTKSGLFLVLLCLMVPVCYCQVNTTGKTNYNYNEEATFFEDSAYLKSVMTVISASGDLKINELLASNTSTNTDESGKYEDWIELYNFGDDTINLKGLYITDNKQRATKFRVTEDTLIGPKKFVIVWADEEPGEGILHTNFKLDGEGESIYLFANDGVTVIDSAIYGQQTADVSFGRISGDFLTWNYFETPTPGSLNPDQGKYSILQPPVSDKSAGFYNQPFCMRLFHFDPTVQIYYTLDGSEPDNSSSLYSDCISIDTTTIVRFRAVKNGYVSSKIVTISCFFTNDYNLDVLSLVSDNKNLNGPNGILSNRSANIERPVHIEYFGADEMLKFSINGGIKVHASGSTSQVAFRLYARSEYGDDEMKYNIFNEKNITRFKRLVLRNAGNDGVAYSSSSSTNLRDPINHVLFGKINPENAYSAFKPVHVFINGSYNGIYNLRERIDKYYIRDNFHYEGDMDLLENAFGFASNKNAIEGSWKLYDSIKTFMDTNDMTDSLAFSVVEKNINTDEFIDYWIHEVFIGNFDWLVNNIKIFRPHTGNGKFAWILWDTDHGLGLPYYNYGSPEWNTLDWSLSIGQVRTEGGTSNVLERNFIKNPKARNKFITRFADLLNTYYAPGYTGFLLDSIYNVVYPDFHYQMEKWSRRTFAEWERSVNEVSHYLEVRPDIVRNHIKYHFHLDSMYKVKINVNDPMAGTVCINTLNLQVPDTGWTGIYFTNVPVSAEAKPKQGYKFTGWKNSLSNEPEQTFYVHQDTLIEALFEPEEIDSNRIIINEICYRSSKHHNNNEESSDWLEIYNGSGTRQNLSQWRLLVNSDFFDFPDITLNSDDYLVIRQNSHDKKNTVTLNNTLEFPGFILPSPGGELKLLNNKSETIDSVFYENTEPWPVLADDPSFTLELISPFLDNSFPENWRASIMISGTPGKINFQGFPDYHGLVINEVKAVNNNYPDEDGDNDDWIELFNSGYYPLDLRGLLVTDNPDNQTKSQIPNDNTGNYILGPKEFIILWADDEPDEGPYHLGFKLDADGESVQILQNTGREIAVIDVVDFGIQSDNYAYARNKDGLNSWGMMSPTPGYSNIFGTINNLNDEITETHYINIYPNPANSAIYINSGTINKHAINDLFMQLVDITGKVCLQTSLKSVDYPVKLDISKLNPGYYILMLNNFTNLIYTKTVIIAR